MADYSTKGRSEREPSGAHDNTGKKGKGGILKLFKSAITAFFKNRSLTLAASLSYYAIFSVAPIILIMLAIVGRIFGDTQARQQIIQRVSSAAGPKTAEFIDELLRNASEPKQGIWSMVVGFVLLFIGATGLFQQLKDALNQVWNVRPKPGHAIGQLIRTRLIGFGLVLLMGVALMALLASSAVVSGMAERIQSVVAIPEPVLHIVDLAVSFGIISTLLAVIYRYLPDAKIGWRETWRGGLITAALLALGKVGLGLYLGKAAVSSSFGAAGSMAIALVWIYYSSAILLLGAEMTQCYAEMYGKRIEPADWAESATVKEVPKQPGDEGYVKPWKRKDWGREDEKHGKHHDAGTEKSSTKSRVGGDKHAAKTNAKDSRDA
ncbi:MAG TPA: YihY/virulence factor BrkB family protein [Phycisphaerales bacterium]|nr:YihY/virulence factor BrkB family protein [Phycisphaerales bacterium]